MAKDVNKVKKINGKEIIADWSNIENKPNDLLRVSDIEGLATEEYVDDRFKELTGAAPEALDTLEELAKALGEDENFSATVIDELGNKIKALDGINTVKFKTKEQALDSMKESMKEYKDLLEGYEGEQKNRLEAQMIAKIIFSLHLMWLH